MEIVPAGPKGGMEIRMSVAANRTTLGKSTVEAKPLRGVNIRWAIRAGRQN